ncbi:tRNA dimethylallyltransferase [Limihaloglobus sulfuriphilus]|uniref:tRNA dimethylallyltransferase n=2 Tax=Limihaloglobus sulfuriphilus TaxID=1851148 RepID=A0A1Q2MD85_9BACT|nr:tRNA dimethylallyltransferase [Limihaloglobus sulfuriphilus]
MIMIIGVTGSGKSRLAYDLAVSLEAEIVSIDSMKVYRGMDIGTAKPPIERRRQVKYHLIDVVDPWESFSVSRFLELSEAAIADIKSRGRSVVGAGGTAMYVKNMLYGLFEGPGSDHELRNQLKDRYNTEGGLAMHKELESVDPEAAARIHPNDQRRIVRALEVFRLSGKPISSFQTQFSAPQPDPRWHVIGVRRAKEVESRRINSRVKKMIELGLVDEARRLYELEKPLSKQASVAIGYAELFEHFEGKLSLEKAIEKIKINTRRLAKSQRTWFKTFKNVHWIELEESESPEQVLSKTLEHLRLF